MNLQTDHIQYRTCSVCEEEFNPNSYEKKRARGNVNHCPDCSVDKAPVLLGVNGADGKMAATDILRFPNQESADGYRSAWRQSTGYNKGKSCQMRNTCALDLDAAKFNVVTRNAGNENHKGKN